MSYAQKIIVLCPKSSRMIFWAFPLADRLRTHYPNAQISFLTEAKYKNVLSYSHSIHRQIIASGKMDTIKTLIKEKPNIIIDLTQSFVYSIVSFLIRSVYLKPDYLNQKHFSYNIVNAAQPLGINIGDQENIIFNTNERTNIELHWIPEPFKKDYTAVILNGANCNKLTHSKLIELLDRINKPVILLGGQSELELGRKAETFFQRSTTSRHYEEGLAQLGKKTIVKNLCGHLSFTESIETIKHAQYVFGGDTLFTHMAAMYNKAPFTFWGSTSPQKSYPLNTPFQIFENKKLSCHPCSYLGKDQCPKGHLKCIKELSFDFYLP